MSRAGTMTLNVEAVVSEFEKLLTLHGSAYTSLSSYLRDISSLITSSHPPQVALPAAPLQHSPSPVGASAADERTSVSAEHALQDRV